MIQHPNKNKSKNYKTSRADITSQSSYDLAEALDLLIKLSFTKFDQTLDIAVNLGVDPKHSDQMVRGVVKMPSGTGKTVRVAVICKEDKIPLLKDTQADVVGSLDIIEKIKAGQIDCDVYITTPDMMGAVGQVARILGPKGLMPNPKLGTVTNDLVAAVNDAKGGQVEFRVEKAGIVHAGIGKLSFGSSKLVDNAKAFMSAISKAKPATSKGLYIKQVILSSTMGPGFKVNISSLGL